jgi:hypothetical protein
MIKINLATKKQAVYAAADQKKSLFAASDSNKSMMFTLFPRLILPALIAMGANFGFDYWAESRNTDLQAEIAGLEEEKRKLAGSLKNFAGFEAKKAELNGMLDLFGSKVSVFDSLVKSRDSTLRALVVISKSCPKDVWMSSIRLGEKNVEIKGKSIDIGLVSDVMEKMTTSQIFKDVQLKSSVLEENNDSAVFELSAGRI